MKTLILMRHAKSGWDDPNSADIDRPLAPRGRAAGPKMGAWLAAEGYLPDSVLCSAARRARETLDLIKPGLPKKSKTQYSAELYMATPREILNLVAKAPKEAASLLLVGHNPGIGNLASWLVGSGDRKLVARLRAKFPTASIAVFRFDADKWSDIAGESGELRAFIRPRDLD